MTGPATTYGRRIPAGTELHRIHRDRTGSVAFFDTHPERGRFNLVGVAGRGTCYLAMEPLGSYVETLGRILSRPVGDIEARRYSVVTLDRDIELFDLTMSEARSAYVADGLDLTATVGAGDSYELPQRLALLTHDDGYDGILYTARHDNSHSLECVAFFGPAGANDNVFNTTKTDHVPQHLIDLARQVFGITILPNPPNTDW